ncbi:hypothetical protein [Eikenella exigua]|uniref:hypothetical protein n=1 Tax=Eikenella exigua TaxID=2528037 RepID=UPI00129A896F|nr:hypothetical protein [Eikenella exigua]
MKRLLKRPLRVTVILILAAVAILYVVSEWLKQREIRAAEADLALLAAPPAPPPSVKNGIDALWLLEYRTASDDERADLMRRFGHIIPGDLDAYRQHSELVAKRLPPSDDILTFNGTAAEYLAEIRANPPKYRAEAAKHAELFANVDNLADYDTFAPRDWPNNKEDLGSIRLPHLSIAIRSHTVAALDWAQGRENEAWRRVCRNIKTGRSLLHSRPGLIYPMIGNAIILRNTGLAAQMLYEKPEWANHLPAECGGMFEVLAGREQSLCLVMQDEFHLATNLSLKLEGKGWQMMQVQEGRELLALGEEQSDAAADFALLALPRFDAVHSLVIAAPHYAAFCKPAATAVLRADRKVQWSQPTAKTFARKWACLSNSVGCRYVDQAMPLFDTYVHRLQDTAMQQRAFNAALALYRLPAGQRRAALDKVLAEHSSPSRKLSWNEQERMIYFDAYSQNKVPDPIPVNLNAEK